MTQYFTFFHISVTVELITSLFLLMKHFIHPILHYAKKHTLLSLVGVSLLGIFSYTFITIAAPSAFIEERVNFILSAFEANEKKHNLTGNDRVQYYQVLRDIYSWVVNGLNMKLGENVSSAIDESIDTWNQATSNLPKQKYNDYVFYIRNLPIRVQRGDTLSGIVWGKKLIVSCGDKAKNDMVQYTSVYDGNGNGMIRVSDVTECMKKGKDLVLSTDHTSLCGLFGTARWSSQIISPSVASLDTPDTTNGTLASWTFSCVNPPWVNPSVACKGNIYTTTFVTNGKKCELSYPDGQLNETLVRDTMVNGAQWSAKIQCTSTGWVITEWNCVSWPATTQANTVPTPVGSNPTSTPSPPSASNPAAPVSPSTPSTPTNPSIPASPSAPVEPIYGPGCTDYNNMNWNCSPTSEINPLSCRKYGNNIPLENINYLQSSGGGIQWDRGGTTPESQKVFIRTWTNTDVTNLQFDDATGWATWGSSSNPTARCKIRYAVTATCGSAAWQPINRDPSIGFRMGADTPNLCSRGAWKQTMKSNGTLHDYLIEWASSTVTASDPAFWENASLIYTCGWLNGGADVECKTGKVKQDWVCGKVANAPQILSCNGGILNTSKTNEYNANGVLVKTYEKSRYDQNAYIDGEYNWECQWVNGGTTTQCSVENYASNAACSSEYISRGAVDRIMIGTNAFTIFLNRTRTNIQFSGTCASSYPAGVTCRAYNYDPSKLCVVPYWFWGNPADLVRVTDEAGTDGAFNWTCAGSDRFGNPTSATVDCTVPKVQ